MIGTDYTLTINELMKEDAGSYSCEVSVNFGSGNRYSVENTFIQVLVYGKCGRDGGVEEGGGGGGGGRKRRQKEEEGGEE